jgi:Ca2+/Na+ antiporter
VFVTGIEGSPRGLAHMNETVGLSHLIAAGAAGASVVLFGGSYALLLALGHIRQKRQLRIAAYVCYLLLGAALLILSVALRLDALWNGILAVLFVAYLIAPHFIWHLTLATHRDAADERAEITSKPMLARTHA